MRELSRRPIVIGHRGASGYRPEHTLESYRLAIALGADYIEPDLVATRDHGLVARHENEIGSTTDVASHPEFAARRTEKLVDGRRVAGFFTEDFTLAELKTLRARERLPDVRPHNCAFDGAFEVPTLEEILALAAREGRERGRRIGVYPETKHPSYFRALGLPLEPPLLAAVHAAGYRDRHAPLFIQSFELANLRELRAQCDLPLTQLVDARGAPFDAPQRPYAELIAPAGLAELAQYVDAIGVNKQCIVPWSEGGESLSATRLIDEAHALGLAVHAWTFRAESCFLPRELRARSGQPTEHGDLACELERYFSLGVDGVFADHPDLAADVRARC
jgi:glycerophosphoryl diester phosphodiesterase